MIDAMFPFFVFTSHVLRDAMQPFQRRRRTATQGADQVLISCRFGTEAGGADAMTLDKCVDLLQHLFDRGQFHSEAVYVSIC